MICSAARGVNPVAEDEALLPRPTLASGSLLPVRLSMALKWVKSPWLGVCLWKPHAVAFLWSSSSLSASLRSLGIRRRCFVCWVLSIARGLSGVLPRLSVWYCVARSVLIWSRLSELSTCLTFSPYSMGGCGSIYSKQPSALILNTVGLLDEPKSPTDFLYPCRHPRRTGAS